MDKQSCQRNTTVQEFKVYRDKYLVCSPVTTPLRKDQQNPDLRDNYGRNCHFQTIATLSGNPPLSAVFIPLRLLSISSTLLFPLARWKHLPCSALQISGALPTNNDNYNYAKCDCKVRVFEPLFHFYFDKGNHNQFTTKIDFGQTWVMPKSCSMLNLLNCLSTAGDLGKSNNASRV